MARVNDHDVVRIDVVRCGSELAVRGELNVHTVADVRIALSAAVDDGVGDLVLHLGDAEIGDATGLGVIVGAHHRAVRAGRRLVLADASLRLERLMRATGLHRVIPLSRQLIPQPAILAPGLS
ncbi:STAS domain-containing protein [Flexivirga caeni]|uniref:Anti-sigma factor antagonist n=1 Tax=Flexivirga caeni TaxID=2294115 RepID=A0A3M9M5N4_9MICO|nr:STAS domain-containing protein [Flexivirga caeni]RNI20884.1 anti-sigma factor antagonist [Flexivirga caeni]